MSAKAATLDDYIDTLIEELAEVERFDLLASGISAHLRQNPRLLSETGSVITGGTNEHVTDRVQFLYRHPISRSVHSLVPRSEPVPYQPAAPQSTTYHTHQPSPSASASPHTSDDVEVLLGFVCAELSHPVVQSYGLSVQPAQCDLPADAAVAQSNASIWGGQKMDTRGLPGYMQGIDWSPEVFSAEFLRTLSLPPPKDPQAAFDKARSVVSMEPWQETRRRFNIEIEGEAFMRDAVESARKMPGMSGHVGDTGGSESLPASGAGDVDVVSSASTGSAGSQSANPLSLHLVAAGGHAGGAKAIDDQLGLFLKVPDDSHGIYGSMVMAAKVMKLEVNANRHIHGMDSIHVNAPLSALVDVPYEGSHGVTSVLRVQVQAKLAIGKDTLRVGSSNGGYEIHQDKEQKGQVVDALCDRFHLAPIEQRLCTSLVQHQYVMLDDVPVTVDGQSRTQTGASATQALPEWILRIKTRGINTSAFEGVLATPIAETADMSWLAAAVEESGIRLGRPCADIAHIAIPSPCGNAVDGTIPAHELPFDAEVHQLPSGQRIVLDSHRLLIPDLAWMDWMQDSVDARPRMWVVLLDGRPKPCHEVSFEADSQSSGSRSYEVVDDDPYTWPQADTDTIEALCSQALRWVAQNKLDPTVVNMTINDELSFHRGAGCVLFKGCDEGGATRCVVVVSCPAWYFGNNPGLTCLLPAEASSVMAELKLPRVSPDVVLKHGGDPSGSSSERETLVAVSARLCADDRLSKVAEDLIAAASNPALHVFETESLKSDHFSVWRRACKRVLHRHGIGLRHAGRVWHHMNRQGSHISVGVRRLLLSACVPRSSSPSGAALRACCTSACRLASPGSDLSADMVSACVLQARVFAAKGLAEVPMDCIAEWVTALDIHDMGVPLQPSSASEVPTGVRSALEHSIAGYAVDGPIIFDVAKAQLGVKQLLEEIAHTQRVNGYRESELLSRLVTLASHGGQYRPFVARLIDQVQHARNTLEGGSGKAQHMREDPLGTMHLMLRLAGFHREAIGILGGGSSGSAGLLSNLAAGKTQDALPELQRFAAWQEQVNFKYTAEYITTLIKISSCYKQQGMYEEAVGVLEKGLEIAAQIHVEGNPTYAGCLQTLADSYFDMGQRSLSVQSRALRESYTTRALQLYEQSKDGLRRMQGDEHQNFLGCLNSMANCHMVLGQPATALPLYEESARVMMRVLSKDHPESIKCYLGLALCYSKLERHVDAELAYLEVRTRIEQSMGKQDKSYLTCLYNMALNYRSMGKHENARQVEAERQQIQQERNRYSQTVIQHGFGGERGGGI